MGVLGMLPGGKEHEWALKEGWARGKCVRWRCQWKLDGVTAGAGVPGWGFHDFEEGCQALGEAAGSG